MHAFPRSLQILSAVALLWGIGLTAAHSLAIGSLTAPGSTVLDAPEGAGETLRSAAYVMSMERADAGIQLITGILLILLGFFLHAFARMQNGERPVHISVKERKEKRRMWYWVEMRM